jgi:hypothetical protein
VITSFWRPRESSSTVARPRIRTEPRPVRKYSLIPSFPMITPPVGKSGPLMCFMSCWGVMSGLSIAAITPSMTSPRLWGGMFVAIPTAIPAPPFTRRCGIRAGMTVGSSW